MYLRSLAAAAAAMTFVLSTSAEASRWHYWDNNSPGSRSITDDDEQRPSRSRSSRATRTSSDDSGSSSRSSRATRVSYDDGGSSSRSGLGPRPSAWCGWFMRTRHGGGPEFNLAANWRKWGSPGEPRIGAIVVWPHHVGEIVGKADNGQWIILSGNDGGAVRSRPRSIAGATIRV